MLELIREEIRILGPQAASPVERGTPLQSIRYQRFHCISIA